MPSGALSGSEEDAPERIPGLYAVPPALAAEGTPYRLPKVDAKAQAILNAARLGSQIDGFVEAGWSFVDEAHISGPALDVYKLANGRLGLVGKMLNVKFSPKVSPSEIEVLLGQHHMRKQRDFGFSKNLMTVEIERRGGHPDPFSLAQRLAHHPGVEFAEPVVLEEIGFR